MADVKYEYYKHVASVIFSVLEEKVTDEQRAVAKKASFLFMYSRAIGYTKSDEPLQRVDGAVVERQRIGGLAILKRMELIEKMADIRIVSDDEIVCKCGNTVMSTRKDRKRPIPRTWFWCNVCDTEYILSNSEDKLYELVEVAKR